MINNAILYRFDPLLLGRVTAAFLDGLLQTHAFVPCEPTQEKSFGFVPPRGEAHGALVESIGGQLIMKLMTETRVVPASAIAHQLDEKLQQILTATGRKPGKKETRDIKDDIRLALMPTAFPKQEATLIWIDLDTSMLVIGASSQAKADNVVTCLVRAINDLAINMLSTQTSPTAGMSEWLFSGDAPANFTVDRDCELKACDESKAVIRYSRCSLESEEIRQHIQAGRMATRLALTWSDRVSFVLTDNLHIKRIAFLDAVFDGGKKSASSEDNFDADVAIFTGELRRLIPDLVGALGGGVTA
jgi:recombination associated protein RdgC